MAKAIAIAATQESTAEGRDVPVRSFGLVPHRAAWAISTQESSAAAD